MNRNFSPSDIEVLIHCHVSPEPHPRREAPAVRAFLNSAVACALIAPMTGVPGGYTTTGKGAAFITMLCATPLPEEGFIDPRTGEVIR